MAPSTGSNIERMLILRLFSAARFEGEASAQEQQRKKESRKVFSAKWDATRLIGCRGCA